MNLRVGDSAVVGMGDAKNFAQASGVESVHPTSGSYAEPCGFQTVAEGAQHTCVKDSDFLADRQGRSGPNTSQSFELCPCLAQSARELVLGSAVRIEKAAKVHNRWFFDDTCPIWSNEGSVRSDISAATGKSSRP